jgi:putative nucleotidyltransferase with HDIG domain
MELQPELGIHELMGALGDSDPETYRHSLEVAESAIEVAKRLGLDHAQRVEVELGALLHDVGKLRLPPALLNKPDRLTHAERRLIRMHPDWGADMVARIPGLEIVALIVRLHHERPDGLGYPYGLSQGQIPVAARIVSVCDAYGAMTKRRPYSEPLALDDAVMELHRNAGTQFDPDVVEALIEFVRPRERLSA